MRPQDDLLRWPDDLSCGPIATDEAVARAAWWGHPNDKWKLDSLLNKFWERIAESRSKLVVWFARHSASELAFFLNWSYRLGDQEYEVIDVTGLTFPTTMRDSTPTVTEPAVAVSHLVPRSLATLIGTERQLSGSEKEEACLRWRHLKRENSPFRIVSEDGLVSAPETYFDHSLIELATGDWQRLARLIGDAMHKNWKPYIQVYDLMLWSRVVALIDEGKLLADGDPWDMPNCRVRLPD
jgi:Protein of unknown function/Domain of unknown function (DUF1835)